MQNRCTVLPCNSGKAVSARLFHRSSGRMGTPARNPGICFAPIVRDVLAFDYLRDIAGT